jgi:hypothetical protein
MNSKHRGYVYIPPCTDVVVMQLSRILSELLKKVSKTEFLKAYCSFVYLYPGFPSDDWLDWQRQEDVRPLLRESWLRARAEQLTDNELYPPQVVRAAVVPAWQ